ncbi:MAG: PhaM family polyhydroxyalkanoate granule multifunctional regulatory protein [Burkholderiales bacterium]|nr:PhaM family polyhydroxyalkanoate granule multifunctional regulatory protein [Burkholderiales bacterium]
MPDAKQPQDPFEMFRRLWGPLGLPVPGMAMPTLDPGEIEKRIADLRSIEGWLSMNLNMVRMAISGLEVQKSALEAMQAAGRMPGAGARRPTTPEGASGDAAAQAMLWPWTVLQRAMENVEREGKSEKKDTAGGRPKSK